jgi:hypothetical protein
MSNTDFSGARAALTGALTVAGPVLAALQQADQVLGVMQNAEKHSKLLNKTVADLQEKIVGLTADADAADARLRQVMATIPAAEQEAQARAAAAVEAEKQAIAAAKKASATAIGAAQDAAAKAIAAAEGATIAAQIAADARIAGMTAKEKELNEAIAALESKLDKLKVQAQKFAAALTAE